MIQRIVCQFDGVRCSGFSPRKDSVIRGADERSRIPGHVHCTFNETNWHSHHEAVQCTKGVEGEIGGWKEISLQGNFLVNPPPLARKFQCRRWRRRAADTTYSTWKVPTCDSESWQSLLGLAFPPLLLCLFCSHHKRKAFSRRLGW